MTRIRWSWWLPLPLVMLGGTGYLGISNALGEYAGATNLGQRIATVAEFTYGLCGVIAAMAVIMAHRRALSLVLVWCCALTLCAGLAAYYWGGTGLWTTSATLLATALIVGLVFWLSKRALLAGAGAPR